MHFTREPIIETIISPKEGHKIVVRNSKVSGQEDYFVDAVEVVSFGQALFFRSLERPKPFLVPVTDYEIVEVRETRMILKNVAASERSIKIGGGRDQKATNSEKKKSSKTAVSKSTEKRQEEKQQSEQRQERKTKKRTVRRKRPQKEPAETEKSVELIPPSPSRTVEVKGGGTKLEGAELPKGGDLHDETDVSSSVLSLLFPPPATLISQKIEQNKNTTLSEGVVLSDKVTGASENEAQEQEQEQEQEQDTSDLEDVKLVTASSTVISDSISEEVKKKEKESFSEE